MDDGDEILNVYQSKTDMDDSTRKKFVRFVVQKMIIECGYWPSAATKRHYAQICVTMFPCFKTNTKDNEYVRKFIYFIFICIIFMPNILLSSFQIDSLNKAIRILETFQGTRERLLNFREL